MEVIDKNNEFQKWLGINLQSIKRNGPDYYRNVHQHFFEFADDFVPVYITTVDSIKITTLLKLTRKLKKFGS